MDLRIKGLSHLDPLTVPLPNGTEVVTRADPNRDDVEAWLIQKRLAFAAQAEKA